jgi:hypothetical protein
MSGDGISESGWHLFRGGKTYGPLSDEKFRRLIEAGKIKSDDLIWRPGFEDWRKAGSVLGGPGPPPIPSQNESSQRARSQGRAWKLGLGAAVATAVFAALYIASPYYTLWRLKHAIVNKDSLALERIVDWPGIRNQIRSEALAASYGSTLPDTNAFAALGTALGSAMVGPYIESFINPAVIIRASENRSAFVESVDVRSGYFVGPMTFRLDVLDIPGDEPGKLALILEFQGTGWRVTHVDFPWEKVRTEIELPK